MEENLGGDSNANPHNGSLSAHPLLAFDVQPLPHQPNDADVGVVQPEPEPDAEDDDDAAEVDDEAEADDDADDNAERPKLDEGYYEIEGIRRKRVRKVTFFSHSHKFFSLIKVLSLLFIFSSKEEDKCWVLFHFGSFI